MALNKQMELFDEGGLLQEGGSVDEESGNDVPVGSLKEEVRDDIPAQLSEGEFVMPADVVRFHGLDKMMALRDEAKMGLQRMDDMGQMGNSEEAVIPDGIPFNMDDLEIEDEPMEMQVGGFVQPQTGMQYTAPSFLAGYEQTPTQPFQPQQSVYGQGAVGGYQPTFMQGAQPQQPAFQAPTFGTLMPKYVTYINEQTKAEIQVPVDEAGNPLIPVAAGFVLKSSIKEEEKKPEETPTVVPTTVGTAQVTDSRDADHVKSEEEKFGPGGGRLGIGGTVYGVSFADMGTLPGVLGSAQGAFGLATGEPLPAGATVTMQTPTINQETGDEGPPDIFTLTSGQYNSLKDTIKTAKGGANSKEVKDMLEGFKSKGRARHAVDVQIKNMRSFTDSEEMKNALSSYKDNMEKQIEIGNVKEDGSIINPFEMAGARGGGGGSQLFQETSGDQTSQAATSDDGFGDFSGSYDPGGTSDPGQEQDFGNSSTGGYYDFNKGGLAAKPKPKKTKKMKKGGLASKK